MTTLTPVGDIGPVLLAAGLLRARAVPRWAPWSVWGVLAISFGFIGYRMLAMTPAAWSAADLAQAPVAASSLR